jgi:uncharacterized protein (TIGR02145 family)
MKRTSSPSRIACAMLFLVALALCIAAPASAQSTDPIQVGAGWNLLSLPASVGNGSRAFLFPSAVSPAYIFHHPAGYVPQDTLHNETGFWLKFNSPDTLQIAGKSIFEDTIEVRAGWNIIGSLAVPIIAESIQTDPAGIVTSQFFGYVPGVGYHEADTLYPGLGYWVKVNQDGAIVLSSSDGWPCPGVPTVFHGGKTYNTVQIGTQCWLRENLDVGTRIDGIQEQTNNSIIEKYCYGDNPANCDSYGGLYQWNEAMLYDTTAGIQGICPLGWHIPTWGEFQALGARVGGDGNALKAIGQGSGGGVGTNTCGFSALLAGYRYFDGYFYNLSVNAFVWSSTQAIASIAGALSLDGGNGLINLDGSFKADGFNVRCIRDSASNLFPNAPSNPSPDSLESNVFTSTTLSWTFSDPDGDPLTYDVYFGTDNPPATIISSNQPDTSLAKSGLTGETTYYWKVVARDNQSSSTSSPVWSFTTQSGGGSPCAGTPSFIYEDKRYHTVQIGSQCWLRENLDVGTMVLGAWDQTNNSIIEKYCWGDNPAKCDTGGGLYQWNEAMQYDTAQGGRGICPAGWHIPTRDEFATLAMTAASDGNALKEIGQGLGEGAGTNTSGFSALLAGYRLGVSFTGLAEEAIVWSSKQYDAFHVEMLYLRYDDDLIRLPPSPVPFWSFGFSVRCLKD